ncbi:MAG: hypothetical protein ABSB40_12205 [Nitrososphaeria archaeon]|jgi:hypothetical protein
MNVIAWLALANIIMTGLLMSIAYMLRQDIIAFDEQNINQYKRMKEIITDLLKLKEIKKKNE